MAVLKYCTDKRLGDVDRMFMAAVNDRHTLIRLLPRDMEASLLNWAFGLGQEQISPQPWQSINKSGTNYSGVHTGNSCVRVTQG